MAENWGLRPLFGEGSGSPYNIKVPCAEVYLHTKWHLDASSRWPHYKWAENWGGGSARPLFTEGGAGSPSDTKSPGLPAEAYLHAK